MADCIFCQIIAGGSPATVIRRWDDAIAIVPLGPVVAGHLLVIPTVHVIDALADPAVTAATVRRAAEITVGRGQIVTSAALPGEPQHLAIHVVPYQAEGEELPWTPQGGDCPVCFRPRVRRSRKRSQDGLRTCGRPSCGYELRARQVRGNVYGNCGGGPPRTDRAGYSAIHARARKHFKGWPCSVSDGTCSGRVEVALRPEVPQTALRHDPDSGSLFYPGLDIEFGYRPLCRSHHAREGGISATLRRYPALHDAVAIEGVRAQHGDECLPGCGTCVALSRYDEAVRELHVHIVPRAVDDGLALPWYSGRRAKAGGRRG